MSSSALHRIISAGIAAMTLIAGSSCARASGGASARTENPTYTMEMPAMAYPSNPRPRYPAELVATGDTGTVLIRVAIEKNGMADMKSVTVVHSPNPAFTKNLRDDADMPRRRFSVGFGKFLL